MKNLFIALFFLLPVVGSAQTKKDIFNPNVPLVFFGADYSLVQFTKAEEFTNKPDILRLFVDCNNLLKQRGWQDLLKKKLRRHEIKTDLSYVTKTNGAVEWEKVFSDNLDYSLSDETVENMIKNLNIDQGLYKDHLGMVICEENCSKTNKRGKVAVAFFGINDLKPILIKHYSLKSDGIGFLYYWADINMEAIKIMDELYKELKK